MATAKRGKAVDSQRKPNGRNAKGQFEKGNDEGFKGHPERIHKGGRPKSHEELRKLIQRIAGEAVDAKPEWSQIELMLRSMMKSKSAEDRKQILEHGWGKVPQDLNVNLKDLDDAISRELARLAGADQTENAGTAPADADAPGEPGQT